MLSVGVTGHRNLENFEDLDAAVVSVLNSIEEKFGRRISRVISPLAEGADRIIAKKAITVYSAELIVPHPFDLESYLLDFDSDESKQEFKNFIKNAADVIQMPHSISKNLGYLASGRYVLVNCDVLIAIWDGNPSRGIGGTGQIVGEARNVGKPIAWIEVSSQAENLKSDRFLIQIHYERFPA